MFGLQLHWGDPNSPTEIRAWIGTMKATDRPESSRYVSHQVARWYGISRKRKWFVGFFRLGRSESYSTPEAPRTTLI